MLDNGQRTLDPSSSRSQAETSTADGTTTNGALQSPICAICTSSAAIYTCPRCQLRTCSLQCSTTHKKLGEGCSGIRNKAAYVPMNQYGYMTLMNDYVFLEEVGRKVGDWGKEIVVGGYQASGGQGHANGKSRGRGRGRGAARGSGRGGHTTQPPNKRELLKMQLDFLDIEMDLLPVGMERRVLNQSSWEATHRTALLTIEFIFHPPRFLLPSSTASSSTLQPVRILTHRNRLDHSLKANLIARLTEKSTSKKKGKEKHLPDWLTDLVQPHAEDPDAFVAPTCVMCTTLDPLAALSSKRHLPGFPVLRPGHVTRKAYYKLDYDSPLSHVLKHKNFVEFPVIEVWEDGSFHGAIVNDEGSLVHDDDDIDDELNGGRKRKRRKLGKKAGKKAMVGLLGGYGSGSDSGEGDHSDEKNVLDLLAGYSGSDDEDTGPATQPTEEGHFDFEFGDEDAEGETDDGDYDYGDDSDDEKAGQMALSRSDPETLAKILDELRQAGALRDPGADHRLPFGHDDEDQVDWGDSGDEA